MGQTKAQIVKKSLASEMSLNADAKIGKIEAVSDGREEYICQTCGKSYKRRKGNFSPSKSPIYAGTDGYLNTCKNCVDNLFTQYTEFLVEMKNVRLNEYVNYLIFILMKVRLLLQRKSVKIEVEFLYILVKSN